MDEFDIYDDLDEFHEQEEKKSKELLALEVKYEEALKTIEANKMEKKDLRKKIRIMETNLQSLLDTAKAEMKRKDKIIEDLRKEKDDLCFRRRTAYQKSRNEPLATANSRFMSQGEWNTNKFNSNENNVNITELNPSHQLNKVVEVNPVVRTKNVGENDIFESDKKAKTANSHDNPRDLARSQQVIDEGLPVDKKHENRTDCQLKSDFRNQDFHKSGKEKHEHKPKRDLKHEPKYRDRSRELSRDISKSLRTHSKNKSRERSFSPRYDDSRHSNRRKDDKGKQERRNYDDHSSYRKHKNERRNRSRSSDKHDKLDLNRRHVDDSTKKSKHSERKSSQIEREEERRSDRKYRSRVREDQSTFETKQRSNSRKRRRSSSSAERRHKKSTKARSSRECKDENSEVTKTLPVTISLALEDIASSDDEFVTESKEKLPSKQTDSKGNYENKNNGEDDDINVPECKKNSDKCKQRIEICDELPKSTENHVKSNPILQNALSITPVELKIANETSSPEAKFESKSVKDCTDSQETVLTEGYDEKISAVIEKNTQDDIEDVVITQQVVKEKRKQDEQESNENSISLEQKKMTDDKMTEPDVTLKKSDIACEDLSGMSNNSASDKCLNLNESSKSSEETVKKSETASKFVKKSVSLLDELFGATSFSTNATACRVLDNTKELPCDSDDSSITTSPDLYTDISETQEEDPNKTEMPREIQPYSKIEIQTGPDEPNIQCEDSNDIKEKADSNIMVEKCKMQKSCEKSEEELLTMTAGNCDTAKKTEKCEQIKEDKLNSKVLPLTVVESGNSCDEIEVVKIFSNNDFSNERIPKSNSNSSPSLNCTLITGTFEKDDRDVQKSENPTTDTKTDTDNSTAKLAEQDLHLVRLVDVTDDKVINISPPKLNENKEQCVDQTELDSNSCLKQAALNQEIGIDRPIDQNVIEDMNIVCSTLQSKSEDPSFPAEVLTDEEHEVGIQTNTEEFKQIEDAADSSICKLVLESDEDIEPSLSENNLKDSSAQKLNSNSKTPIIVELDDDDDDDDDENSVFNLTISSDDDEDDQTLAELQRKCKLQQKEKIQIIENIRLPALYQGNSVFKIKRTPTKSTERPNNFDFKEKSAEANSSKEKDEMLRREKIPTILINEQKSEMEEDVLNVYEIEAAKEGSAVSECSKKCSSDFTEPTLVAETTQECYKYEETNAEKTFLTTKPKEHECLTSTGKIQTSELALHEAEDIAIQATESQQVENILNLPADLATSIESPKEKTNKKAEFDQNVEVITTDNIPKIIVSKQETPSSKPTSPTENPKSFVKLDVVKSKDNDRQLLTEHNGKIIESNKKQKQRDSLDEILSENIQDTGTPCEKKYKLLPTSKPAVSKTPIGRRLLTRELRVRVSDITKTGQFNNKVTENSTSIPCKSTKKIPAKRKRSASPSSPSSPFITNLNNNECDLPKTKAQDLSTSAEVRAMLIDGKSPQVTNDIIATSPVSVIHDTNMDELDKNMQAIFQSPLKLELTLPPNNCAPCDNSTILDVTVNETLSNSTLENENLNKTSDSSFEAVRLSLGSSQYVYERVSENVVNLFITRRRSKKRAKLDTASQLSNTEKVG